MSGEDEVTMVPNPYRRALEAARGRAAPRAGEIKRALDAAHRAFAAGCWVSTTADDFGAALAARRTSLAAVRDDVLAELDGAIAGQPEMVESTAWQVRWRNLGS